jgi:hypothetical protein
MGRPLHTPHVAALVTASLGIAVACGCGRPPQPGAVTVTTKTVIGQVVALGGDPVAGATVVVDTDFSGDDFVRLQTDSEGRFTFDMRAPRCEPHRHGTFGRASVYAPGYGVAGGVLRDRDNIIRLSRAAEISGRALDAFGQPVAGALVELNSVEDIRRNIVLVDPLGGGFTAKSGDDGSWSISGVPASGGIAYVRLVDPRFVSVQTHAIIRSGRAEHVVLIARPGGSIAGRVVYEDGAPAQGVTVFAQPHEGRQPGSTYWSRAETDADGAYLLTGLGEGHYNILVDEGSGDRVAAAHEAVYVSPPREAPVSDLVLIPGAVVQGKVIDGQTGAALPGVRVGGHGPSRPRSSAGIFGVHTDSTGRYTLRLPPGENMLSASTGSPPLESEPQRITLEPGETRTVDFRLRPPRKNREGWWPF